jgi:ubiquitin carboxyl-terminal hydrolase 10
MQAEPTDSIARRVALVQSYKAISDRDFMAASDRGEPFVPDGIYDAIRQNKRFATMQQGQQEDAQEFLGFYLETLHEELLYTLDQAEGRAEAALTNGAALNGAAEDDGWLEVGNKGRTATTRKSDSATSPVSRIFGGLQRSHLRAPGQKDSAIVEPFLTLQLDVQVSRGASEFEID